MIKWISTQAGKRERREGGAATLRGPENDSSSKLLQLAPPFQPRASNPNRPNRRWISSVGQGPGSPGQSPGTGSPYVEDQMSTENYIHTTQTARPLSDRQPACYSWPPPLALLALGFLLRSPGTCWYYVLSKHGKRRVASHHLPNVSQRNSGHDGYSLRAGSATRYGDLTMYIEPTQVVENLREPEESR